MKALIVARLEQMDELVGDNHVEAFDRVGGELARDANGAGFGCAGAQRVFMLRTETRATVTPIAISYACTMSRSAAVTSDA